MHDKKEDDYEVTGGNNWVKDEDKDGNVCVIVALIMS